MSSMRRAWLLYGLFAVLTTLVVGYTRLSQRDAIQSHEMGRLQTLARVASANMVAHLLAIDTILQTEATRLRQEGLPGKAQREAWNNELRFDVHSTPGVLDMLLMDATGTVLASSREALLDKALADRPFFVRAQHGRPGELVMAAPYRDGQGQYMLLIQHPLRDASGRFSGSIGLALDPEYFASLLSSALYAEDLRCLLVHEDGLVFAAVGEYAPGPGTDLQQPGSLLTLHQQSGLQETQVDAPTLQSAEHRIGVLITVQPPMVFLDRHLVISITRNADAVFAAWRRESYMLVALTALTLLAVAVALLTQQRLQRQQRQREALLQAERAAAAQVHERDAAEIIDLYEHAPCGYHSLDAHDVVQRMNATELRWLGYRREEVVGHKTFAHFLTPASQAAYQAHCQQLRTGTTANGGTVNELPLELLARDGSTIAVLLSATAAYDAHGQYLGARSVLLDYRHLRSVQDALQKALAAAPMAVRIARVADGRVLMVNQAYCRLVHYTSAEASERDVSTYYADARQFQDICARLERGQAVHNELVELQVPHRPDTPRVWTLASYMRINYLGEDAVLAWLFDITDREHLRHQLIAQRDQLESRVQERTLSLQIAKEAAETSERFKSTILANIQHEFRTPMNGILGYINLVTKKLEAGPHRQFLEKAALSGQRLHDTLTNLVDLADVTSYKLQLAHAPFSVNNLLQRLQEQHQAAARAKGLQLRVGLLPEAIETLVGDGARIAQIAHELVGNAIKFSDAGHIDVVPTLAPAPDRIELCLDVTDQGIGIPDEQHDRIFEPFYQGDGSATRKRQGNGLGLALSARLATVMGGSLEVRSSGTTGSVFRLRVPLGIDGSDANVWPEI